MQPWPTAYTYLHRAGKEPMRAIVNRAVVLDTSMWKPNTPFEGGVMASLKVPPIAGHTIFLPAPNRVLVAAGWIDGRRQTAVEILELQPAGKKRMTAEEFLRGHPLKDGDRFGPEVV
jgi:methionyl-tRNA formyltransferase